MENDSIVLVGMPGVGKSRIGGILAASLGYDFVDSDNFIELAEGKKIKQILRDSGESHFLNLEERMTMKLELANSVIATGGSFVYSPKAVNWARESATVIYLEDSVPNIRNRIKNSNLDAVVWNGCDSLISLYLDRKQLYEKAAHITVDCAGRMGYENARLVEQKFHERNKQKIAMKVR